MLSFRRNQPNITKIVLKVWNIFGEFCVNKTLRSTE